MNHTNITKIPSGEVVTAGKFLIDQQHMAKVAEKWAIRLPKSVERTASSPQTAPTVGAESDQQVNICSFAVHCDQMWPSAQ